MKLKQPEVSQYYSQFAIKTASSEKQVVMLHNKCTEHIVHAVKLSFIERRSFLIKAQNILVQLESVLSMTDTVSKGLYYIYDYAYTLLERGNNDDCAKALEIITVIRDTFDELLRKI